jgi:hypothetical protein
MGYRCRLFREKKATIFIDKPQSKDVRLPTSTHEGAILEPSVPLNAAAAAAVVLITVAVAILAKAVIILENVKDVLSDLDHSIKDLRTATLGLKIEIQTAKLKE